MTVRGNEVLVADSGNHRVQVFRISDGMFLYAWGSLGAGDNQFRFPDVVAVMHTGQVLVGDTGNTRIQVFE